MTLEPSSTVLSN